MESNKKYWKGLEELNKTAEFVEKNKHEFAEPVPIEEVLSGSGLSTVTPRRDFLKALGFGVGAVSLAACQPSPIQHSIPYLVKPEEVVPGIPNFYVSSFKGQSILVKTREGRPIKIEANPGAQLLGSGTDAQAQASVLDLYDTAKLKAPEMKGVRKSWQEVDTFVKGELNKVQASGKKIRIISSTIDSPSTKSVIADFVAQYPNTKHIQADAVSYGGIIKANEASFGKAAVPTYRFDKANLIIGFNADFLGTWLNAEEHTMQYVSNRNHKSLKGKNMSRHIQLESGMSLTGTNADTRVPIKLSEEGPALISLYNAITGGSLPGGSLANNGNADKTIKLVAKELQNNRGAALVVSGSNEVSIQILVNAINSAIGSYGATIDLDNTNKLYAGSDTDFAETLNEMNRGEVGAVFFLNSNPAYSYFNPKAFADALAKVALKVSFSDKVDETASVCDVVAPTHNYLESWGDSNAKDGFYSIVQPTINPLFNTRQAEESLLVWSDNAQKSYYQYVRNNWEKNILAASGSTWKELLQKGFVQSAPKSGGAYAFNGSVNEAVAAISKYNSSLVKGDNIEVQLYQTVPLRDGTMANNPLLQELPEPVSKVTWDNFVAIAPLYAEKLGFTEFDLVEVKAENGYSVVLPVLLQPGQANGTVSIAVGYGRTMTGKAGNNVGKNAYPFASYANGTLNFTTTAKLSAAGGTYELAQTQTHHSFEGRNVIREASFAEYKENPKAGTGHGSHKKYDLWDKYDTPGHNWVMAIDLNSCTGCGACVVACNVENNVPVVGRDEVRKRREMHWIRIDRYYSFNENGHSYTKEKEIEDLADLDNVSVVHQPMLCQHCDHAPCETVCPVLATTHSSEGLNQMTYNRCIGTRYCANNCPYKVRRFNWFNYWNDSRFDNYLNNEFTQLVLNPDVTTRSRGVMEKCTMCVQRIQSGKLQAKIEKRPLKDGEVQMACQQACPANAIIFGDSNDPNSEVSQALKNERVYYVLEELNVQPGVGYMTKIRNNDQVTTHHA